MAFRCQEHPQCPGQRAIEFRDGRADVSLFDLGEMVEPMGFKPTTSSMPFWGAVGRTREENSPLWLAYFGYDTSFQSCLIYLSVGYGSGDPLGNLLLGDSFLLRGCEDF